MGNKLIILLMVFAATIAVLTGCASSPTQKRREAILDCTKELIEYNSEATDAYSICRDMYRSRK